MPTINDLQVELKPSSSEQAVAESAYDNLVSNLDGVALLGQIPRRTDAGIVGSAGRGTKIKPLDDIDLMYVMGQGVSRAGGGYRLTRCDFDFSDQIYDAYGHISSRRVVDLFRDRLRGRYPRSEVKRDGQALSIYLSSYGPSGLTFDVVPAFHITDVDHYIIPIGGADYWLATDPRRDGRLLEDLERRHAYTVRPAIRTLKYWFRQKRIVSPRSYHLEALLYHVFTESEPAGTVRSAVWTALSNLNWRGHLSGCPDPTGLSGTIESGLTDRDIENILAAAIAAVTTLESGEERFVEYLHNRANAASAAR